MMDAPPQRPGRQAGRASRQGRQQRELMMNIVGEQVLKAKRPDVWSKLIDAEVLGRCIPGCKSISGSLDDGYDAAVSLKIGPVSATFKCAVAIEDIVEETSYTIVGEGKGGVAGFAKGSAKVNLQDSEEGTVLAYDVDARIGGKLAQLGSRVVGGVARKQAASFFERLQAEVEGSADDGAA